MADIIMTVTEDHTVYVKKEKHIDSGWLEECGVTEEEVREYIETEELENDTELLQGEYDGMMKTEAIFHILTDADTMEDYIDGFRDRKGGTEYFFSLGGLND